MSDELETHKMPLLEHLVELRRRAIYAFLTLILAFFFCYYFKIEIFQFLVKPLATLLNDEGGGRRMIATSLTETFFTYVKVSLFAALFLSFPIIATQLWLFVAPGLYRTERNALLPFLLATPVLFLLGSALAYYVIFPAAWRFFLSFQSLPGADGLPIQLEARVSEYLSFVTKLILAFGASFQLPVLLTLLARVGIITSAQLAKRRRYAIVGAFVIAAVLTPPDVISQIGLAVPLVLLYEASIWSSRMVERRHHSEPDPEDAATL